MARQNLIKHIRSAVQHNIPTTSQLELGEIALNTHDGKIFLHYTDGTNAGISEIGIGEVFQLTDFNGHVHSVSITGQQGYNLIKEGGSIIVRSSTSASHFHEVEIEYDAANKTFDSTNVSGHVGHTFATSGGGLPSQINKAGSFLATDGTTTSWEDLPPTVTVNNTLTSTSTTEALSAAQGKALNTRVLLNDAKVSNVAHPLVETAVPVNALFTDTTYVVQDGELSEINFTSNDHTKLDGIDIGANNYSHPATHAIADTTGLQGALDSKVDDSQVLTNVPVNALFTDTVYNDAAIQGAVALNTAKVSNVDHPLVETAVPSNALFTDTNTTYSVGDGGLTQKNFTIADNTKLDGIETGATADQSASEILTLIKTVDGSGSGLDADLLDGKSTGDLYRRTDQVDGAVSSAGWVTVATNTTGRKHGEVIVSDSDSGDHAYIRIDWMRSYADSNFSVIQVGGHSNRITGVRVLYQTSNNTYGAKLLQVYVTTGSTYGVRVHTLGSPRGYNSHSVVTPVIENTKSGYAVHGNTLEGLDQVTLAAEEGIKAGGLVYASGGDSSQWNTAYGWGNHASAGYVTSSGNTIIGTDSDIDTSGATVIDQLNMTDGVIQSHSTRTLTLANLGYTGATNANNYSLPAGSSSTRGGFKIGFSESGKNYPVETSSEKMYVNVPWTDTNTTYSVGDGGLTQKNFTTTLKTKLDGIATSANNYSHPGTHPASMLTGALPAIDGSALTGIDALPTQATHAGKYLGTDGTTATWNTLDTDANSTTKGLYEHEHTIDADYSITSGNNAMSAGPITISSGYSVTIPTGSTWVIV